MASVSTPIVPDAGLTVTHGMLAPADQAFSCLPTFEKPTDCAVGMAAPCVVEKDSADGFTWAAHEAVEKTTQAVMASTDSVNLGPVIPQSDRNSIVNVIILTPC